MKITKKILALAFMAVAMVFTSCSKDDDNDPVVPTQQEIEAKIIGKWKNVTRNGQKVLTNDRVVATYFKDGTQIVSISKFNVPTVGMWWNKESFTWSVDGNIVCIKPVGVGMTQFNKVVMIDDNQYSYIIMKAIDQQGNEILLNTPIVEQKVTADYSQDIIGLWEGVEMTGYETYGNIEARIEYKADGTYIYYKKVDGEWQPLEDVFDEWNVDGDWLATRWQNNGSDVMNYEWWDIDYIKKEGNDIIMKWSALREKEDGERFTTTFTWKKVEMPKQKEIEEKIIGRWKSISREGNEVTTNNREIRTYDQGGNGSSSTSGFKALDNRFQWSNHIRMSYEISENKLYDKVYDESNYERYMSVTSINDNYLSVIVNKKKINGKVSEQVLPIKYAKVTSDYSTDIIGLWEGVEITGYETYGNAEHRILYNADGTYVYFVKSGDDWVPSSNVDNEYNVDGDWLATRWRPEAGADYNYEWWDIDYIKKEGDETIMKWSALREKEGGERFTTTFTWKKVK